MLRILGGLFTVIECRMDRSKVKPIVIKQFLLSFLYVQTSKRILRTYESVYDTSLLHSLPREVRVRVGPGETSVPTRLFREEGYLRDPRVTTSHVSEAPPSAVVIRVSSEVRKRLSSFLPERTLHPTQRDQ